MIVGANAERRSMLHLIGETERENVEREIFKEKIFERKYSSVDIGASLRHV